MLVDRSQRVVRYLRLSVTEACSMRCTYCRPPTGSACQDQGPRANPQMTINELFHLVQFLVECHGVRKVRLTGGEPTDRRDLVVLLERLRSISGLDELVLTTNGLKLTRLAADLAAAGLDRVNVSLDSLDPKRFAELTGVDGLDRVLEGLDACERAGLHPIRINTVVIRGRNDQDLPSLAWFAIERGWEIRFIELMPMGPLAPSWSERYVPSTETRRLIDPIVAQWEALPRTSDAAARYAVALKNSRRHGVIGFISPMSCAFCDRCDRIRVAADGTVYPCLMDRPSGNILAALRPTFDPGRLGELLQSALAWKADEHPCHGVGVMTRIGG